MLDALVNEANGVPKFTVHVSDIDDHLRLRGLHAVRVLVLLLVVAKEQLTRRCSVGVLARQDDIDTELEQTLSDLLRFMVSCVV